MFPVPKMKLPNLIFVRDGSVNSIYLVQLHENLSTIWMRNMFCVVIPEILLYTTVTQGKHSQIKYGNNLYYPSCPKNMKYKNNFVLARFGKWWVRPPFNS